MLIYLISLSIFALVASQDDCNGILQCLDNLKRDFEECLGDDSLRMSRVERRCGSQTAALVAHRKDLENQRKDAVMDCIRSGGDYSMANWQGCSAFKDPGYQAPPSGRAKRQSRREERIAERIAARRSNQTARAELRERCNLPDEVQECKRIAKSCEKAKMCHLCYETSGLHDAIKHTNFELGLARDESCALVGREVRNSIPDRDEGFSHVSF